MKKDGSHSHKKYSTLIATTLQDKKSQALAIRRENFGNDIKFYAPGLKSYTTKEIAQHNPAAFLPISLTGNACALDCDHCNKKILEPMLALDQREGVFEMCKRLKAAGTESVLISGGSLKSGEVPFMKHIEEIKRVKEELGMKIIMHTGLVTKDEQARALKDAGVDGVALDIIGAQETINDVYHMDATVDDFERTLALLSGYGLSLRPHIILGLHYGEMKGERKALEMIAKYPCHALVLVIITPLHDTNMWGVTPPAPKVIEEFFIEARLKMPDTYIMVGCSRPQGDHKIAVDKAAVEAGLNGIAYPAEGIVGLSKEMGLNPEFFENACSCGVE